MAQGDSGAVAENEKRPHKKYNPLTDLFNVQNCPICGKDFIIHDASQWVYKKRGGRDGKKMLYFCGYNCKQKYLRSKGIIK